MIPTLAEEITKQMCEGFAKQIDGIFLEALKAAGFPSTEEFIKDNITGIKVEGEKFDHYWYHYGQADAKRIISIEHQPTVRYDYPNMPTNNCKQIIEAKYY